MKRPSDRNYMEGQGARTLWALIALFGVALAIPSVSAAGALAGRVDFEDGSPAGGARVVLTPGNYSAITRDDGSFSIALPPGHYVLNATAGNDSSTKDIDVVDGAPTVVILRIVRAGYVTGALNPVPFVFLIAAMAAVFVGGFYVNRRMAETGIDLNKSVLGGAQIRKPFRRRRRKAKPPAPPTM